MHIHVEIVSDIHLQQKSQFVIPITFIKLTGNIEFDLCVFEAANYI